ncbi:WD repeat-containing protein 3-like [Symbiodinium microadriaticum]|uniref:WD repeat-containing protein 3-like n=1 Tax=Symbiodinium microadriaticum TaxID=2951 RepID=A0A1Q9CN34_SYMMI|nr:WD repeat-containing protein 3-like [Symbiodinium microadriaticum]
MQQPWPLGENLGKGFPRLSRAAVEADGLSLKYLPDDQKADEEIVSKAVKQNGLALQFAAERLRSDRQVVLRAVSQNGDVDSSRPAVAKAYLRFEAHQSVGVVTSREANVAYDVTGRLALTGCVDAVGVWNLRQGQQERSLALQGGSHRVTRLSVREARLDDKSVCAVGYMDGSVRLWDIKAGSVFAPKSRYLEDHGT